MYNSPQLQEIYVRTTKEHVVIRFDFKDDSHFEARFLTTSSRVHIVSTLHNLAERIMREEVTGQVNDPT